MKGIAINLANIKPMAGGVAIAQLPVGGWVFAELSGGGTDLINFTHFYRANGEKVELSVPCKVWIGTNIQLFAEDENPIPTDPPTISTYPDYFQIRFPDGLGGWQPWQEYKKNA